jgi:non-ribosomal peptide synthetase component E (peptide arylation enzyme)
LSRALKLKYLLTASGRCRYVGPEHAIDKFVDEYPMTVTGKIQKFKMRNVVIAQLGLEEDAGIETA